MDAVQFRDAILRQRQQVLGAEVTTAAPAHGSTPSDVTALLTEIRDILARMESKG